MRLVVDDVIAQYAPVRGIAKIWKHWLEMLESRSEISVTMISRTGEFDDYADEIIEFPLDDLRFRAHHRHLMSEMLSNRIEDSVFISTYNTYLPKMRNLFIVHDLIPEKMGWVDLNENMREREFAMLSADHLLTVSEKTFHDLRHFYPGMQHRTTSSRTGVSDFWASFRVPQEAVSGYAEAKEYAVIIGSRAHYKRGDIAIEAILSRESGLDVVVVGGEKLTEKLAKNSRVTQIFPDEMQLGEVISGALFVMIPSQYEGFGLPARESIMLGTPVLAWETGVIEEASMGYRLLFSEMGKSVEANKELVRETKLTLLDNMDEITATNTSENNKFIDDLLSSVATCLSSEAKSVIDLLTAADFAKRQREY